MQITLKKVELALKEMQQRKENSYDLVGWQRCETEGAHNPIKQTHKWLYVSATISREGPGEL